MSYKNFIVAESLGQGVSLPDVTALRFTGEGMGRYPAPVNVFLFEMPQYIQVI